MFREKVIKNQKYDPTHKNAINKSYYRQCYRLCKMKINVDRNEVFYNIHKTDKMKIYQESLRKKAKPLI